VDGSIETYLLVGFALSVIASVGGIVVIGIVLVKLPPGYFSDSAARQFLPATHPLVRWTVVFVKNVLGAALVMLGLIMSVPGIPGRIWAPERGAEAPERGAEPASDRPDSVNFGP